MRRISDPFEEFERMRQEMERIMNDMFRQGIMDAQTLENLSKDPNTRVYGVSVRIGPDGKPVVREFGNVKSAASNPDQPPLMSDEREPLVDVIPKEKEVAVIAELPGVEKHEIRLDSTQDSLTISVSNPQRRYHKKVVLPCEVDPKSAAASYKNGVLEVTFGRVLPRHDAGRQIQVK